MDYEPLNRNAEREWRRDPLLRAYLARTAATGAHTAQSLAPVHSGSYRAGIQGSVITDRDGGLAAEISANDPHSIQIEYGTGRPATSRERHQGGRSPRFRVLMRTLLTLRES